MKRRDIDVRNDTLPNGNEICFPIEVYRDEK